MLDWPNSSVITPVAGQVNGPLTVAYTDPSKGFFSSTTWLVSSTSTSVSEIILIPVWVRTITAIMGSIRTTKKALATYISSRRYEKMFQTRKRFMEFDTALWDLW